MSQNIIGIHVSESTYRTKFDRVLVCSNIKAEGPPLTKAASHRPMGMRVPLQGLRAGWGGPTLGQEAEGMPMLPPPGCERRNHPTMQILDSHLALFQRPAYLPHAHHQHLAVPETS